MNWKNVKLIFLRELRDQLRDRRTLFMILIMPILLYPGIGVGMVQFTFQFREKPRNIIVRGAEFLPEDPMLIAGEYFNPELFDVTDEATQLHIVPDEGGNEKLASGEVQVILVVPENIQEQIAKGELFSWQPIYNSADEKSRITYLRLKDALDNWKRIIVKRRLADNELPPNFADPFMIEPHDIATPQQTSTGLIWAKLFPFLLVIMSLTGAFYPSIDLCAGEKERGTMETLLISPAARREIVMGKFCTVWLFSMATALVNLASMAVTGWVVTQQMLSMLPGGSHAPMLLPPPMSSAVWLLLILIPQAAFFSALGIALAAFARSSKEGQYYLTPLLLATLPLILITLAPGIELNPFYSAVPITGVGLLLKALMQGQFGLALQFFMPVLLPTVLYAALALRWAIDQFSREEVLFREAERIDLWLWFRHLIRDKRPYPSAAMSVFCYIIMLLWIVFVGGFLTPSAGLSAEERRSGLQLALVLTQICFVAGPPVLLAFLFTSDPQGTLLLRRPSWTTPVFAVLLAVVLHPIIVEAGQIIQHAMRPHDSLDEQFKSMISSEPYLFVRLFLIAMLPALCEELAFRGFILSGLLRRVAVPTAVILNGFLFGFFHMNPQQLPVATALGTILAIIATRTGSLLPGLCFHFTNNALALLASEFQEYIARCEASGEASPFAWLFDMLYRQTAAESMDYGAPYRASVLILCAAASTFGLTLLFKLPVRFPGLSEESPSQPYSPAGVSLPRNEVMRPA